MLEIISYKYSIPYVLFILFLTFLMFIEFGQINKKQGIRYIRYVVIISFSLFFGLKAFVGRDVFAYYNFFRKLPTIWNWNANTFFSYHFEIGFRVYALILKSIFPNFFFFSFVSVLIDAIILDIVIRRYSKYYVLAFIIYTVFYGHIFEMEQIRNAKALMLFLLSLKYVSEKKFFLYLILNSIGVLFHYSAILYLLIYPFLRRKFSTITYFAIFAMGLTIYFFQIEYIIPLVKFSANILGGTIADKANNYLTSDIYTRSGFVISFGLVERLISYLIFCLFFLKKLWDKDPRNIIIVNMYVLFFISYFYFAEISIISVRMSALFVFAYAVLFPNIFYEIKTKLDRRVLLFILVVFSSARMALYTKYIEYSYENSLFYMSSYQERLENTRVSDKYLKGKILRD